MFRSRKWHEEEEEQDEDAADEVKKKMGARGKDRQRNRCRTDRERERETEGGREKREKGVQRTIETERNLVFEKNAAQARRYFSTFLFRLGFFPSYSFLPSSFLIFHTHILRTIYAQKTLTGRCVCVSVCVYLGSLHTKESGPDKNGKSRLDSLRQMFSLVDKRGSSPRVLSSYLPSRCCIYLPLSLSLFPSCSVCDIYLHILCTHKLSQISVVLHMKLRISCGTVKCLSWYSQH